MLSIKELAKELTLIMVITKAQIKSRYRKTFAGFLWVIMNPILTFAVQALIFRYVLKLQVDRYYIFLLAGVIPWIFITSSISMTVSTFVTQRSTFTAFQIKPWILVLSTVLDNFINYVMSYLILALFIEPSAFFGLIPIFMFIVTSFILLLFTFFVSFGLAILHVLFRDTQFIVQFLINLAYFITPIFYPLSFIAPDYQFIIKMNVFYYFIRPFQNLFWEYDLSLFGISFLQAVLVLTVFMFLTLILWRKNRNALYLKL